MVSIDVCQIRHLFKMAVINDVLPSVYELISQGFSDTNFLLSSPYSFAFCILIRRNRGEPSDFSN